MPIVPENRIGQIEFYEAHLAPWATNAVAIGLTAAQVTAFTTLVESARGAYGDQQAAREAAKAATNKFYLDTTAMHATGADLIRAIKNKALSSGDPNVYVLAQIPPPAPPAPAPPPGTPFNYRVELLETGALKLTWKCNNPSGTGGTIYEVQRKIGSSPEATFIGASGKKLFIDETLPGGSPQVTYIITATRSTARGNPGTFTVLFGTGGGGMQVLAGAIGNFATAEAGGPGLTLAGNDYPVATRRGGQTVLQGKPYTGGDKAAARNGNGHARRNGHAAK